MFNRFRKLFRPRANGSPTAKSPKNVGRAHLGKILEVKIAKQDPLLAYILRHPGILELDMLNLPDSQALQTLHREGVQISVPLVNEGQLIGMLNLGPRMSDQEYSSDDHRLLNSLSVQAASAMRVAQLARRRQEQARVRERIENEMRLARTVQQTLLPKEVPHISGWGITPFWQPAQAVSGDFYDFIPSADGQIGLIIADVTGKGMPAALVMADTRRTLRILAERFQRPGDILLQANQQLWPDIPQEMFATCLYLLLDPATGKLIIANAGHNLPCLRRINGDIQTLDVRGMPLGLLPDMAYEEIELVMQPGEKLFLYSDGVTEAHNILGEMYDFPRLKESLRVGFMPEDIIRSLHAFTGDGWEQEDDITMLLIEREIANPLT